MSPAAVTRSGMGVELLGWYPAGWTAVARISDRTLPARRASATSPRPHRAGGTSGASWVSSALVTVPQCGLLTGIAAYHGPMSRQPGDMRPGRPDRPDRPPSQIGPDRNWRWVAIVLAALIVIAFLLSKPFATKGATPKTYSDFATAVSAKQVQTATVNND